jgi:transcriptional regulator with XRE-family HTH domain
MPSRPRRRTTEAGPDEPTQANPQIVFGANVRLLRLARDWTQPELAAAVHSSSEYVSKVERGNVNTGIRLMHRFALVFDVPIAAMMTPMDAAPPHAEPRNADAV